MDTYSKLFDKMEAKRKLTENREAEKTLTDKVEEETKPTENQKDEIKSLEDTENEKKQSVKVEPEEKLLFKPKVLKSAVNNRTSDIKKPKNLKKIYLIGAGILTLIIAGVVFGLTDRARTVNVYKQLSITAEGIHDKINSFLKIKKNRKEDIMPISASTSFVHTRNSFPGIQNVLKITRDDFASEQEFRKRLREAVSTFNHAVWQHNPDYQAATATLSREGPDIKSGKFPLSMKWHLWTKQLDREGYIHIPSDKAKALLEEGEQKPVYIYLDIVEDSLRISKIAMIGLEEEMTVSFWPGGTIKHDLISDMEFVWIPGRCFTMGSSSTDEGIQVSEMAAHDVCMNGFWMGRYEVTQAQWERIMGQNNSESSNKQSEHDTSNNPVMVFSKEFLLRLNGRVTNDMYRLPSEAEWEYTARAGSSVKYCFGDDSGKLEEYAWYNLNSGNTVHSVGQLKPNKWGLYDMHGNVWELCEDFWHPNYDNAPSDGSVWEGGDQTSRVVRGGGFEDPPDSLRSASRSMLDYDSERQFHRIGFRLVRSGGFLD